MTVFHFEKLAKQQELDAFDCGTLELNQFLVRYARQNQFANAGQTYLCVGDGIVVGYFTLVVGEIAYDTSPERLRKGLARYPIPVMVLARLAIDQAWQGQGLGLSSMKEVIVRTLHAADIAGIRALVVHAKDDAARKFYSHFGFEEGFSDPLHLYALTKDLKALIA